jgi:hypothetical protein
LGLSACAGSEAAGDQTILPTQPNVNALPSPIVSVINTDAIPATEIPTSGPVVIQPVSQATDTSGSSDPYPLPFIKPADSDTPAAGICGNGTGQIVQVKLGAGPDGLPLGGRCVQLTPSQRIELTNPTFESFHVTFSVFNVEVPSGGVVLLDKPVGEYLARGVHFLPHGPEIWLVESAPTPVVTMPPPIGVYLNSELGYSIAFTGDWFVDETGMSSCVCKEVIFYPPNPEPFVAYVSILIDSRTLDELEKSYADFFPDAQKTSITFAGEPGFRFGLSSTDRVEIIFSHQGRTYLIATDRPNDTQVQAILGSFSFIN